MQRISLCFVLVLMTDPAVAYLPGQGYGPYDRGTKPDIWLKAANGSDGLGLVWPGKSRICFFLSSFIDLWVILGVTVFPGEYLLPKSVFR